MIIETHDEKNGTVLQTIWKFRDDEQQYETMWSVCDNPFCGCSELTFGISIGRQETPEAWFIFDFVTEKASLDDKSCYTESSKRLSKRCLDELSEKDKTILGKLFSATKLQCEENVNPQTVEPPEFPVKKIESASQMIYYRTIFPWAYVHSFSIDEKTYYVIDQYCLNSTCECHNVNLDVLGFVNTRHFNKNHPTLISFACNTGKWNVSETGKNAHPPSDLMKELFRKHPDFQSILSRRRSTLKLLYHRHMEAVGFRKPHEDTVSTPKNVGRNAPCPCGSGKKYKKCCGRN